MPGTLSANPAQRVIDHFSALLHRLDELVDAVAEGAVEEDADAPALVLFGWYRSELLPLIKVDRADLLPVGNRMAEPLGTAMAIVADQISAAFEDLDAPEDSVTAAMMAARAQAAVQAYAAARAAFVQAMLGADLAVILGAHPEIAGGERTEPAAVPHAADAPHTTAIEPIAGKVELDVRALSHQARHGVILGKMQALTETGHLILVNDHDPLPLKYQAEAMWPDQFDWNYLVEGPEEWRVAITRT